MTIVLIRHYQVLSEWPARCDSGEFDEACRRYDLAPVEIPAHSLEIPPQLAGVNRIYVSGLPRAQATAAHLFPGQPLVVDPRLNEVSARSFIDTHRQKPLGYWMFRSRLQWALNISRQPEIRRDTSRRAESIIEGIRREGVDCILVGHGFMHACLMRQLRRQAWRGTYVERMRNGQILVFESPAGW